MRVKILSAFLLSTLAGSAQTPASGDVPKRTIFGSSSQRAQPAPQAPALVKPSTTSSPENGRGASSRALDTLNSSTEDLNVIRDGNVRRLSSDGCAPEVSARINDLRARLQAAGVVVASPPSQRTDQAGSENASLALASDWFKRSADGSSSAAAAAKAKEKEDLLDSVLPGKKSAETPGQDTANLKAELERLLTTCTAAKR